MNTLNYKALLIKHGLLIFIRAVGIYLLLTFPALLAFPPMYLISAGYAASFGWIAAALFLLLLYLLKAMTLDVLVKKIILFASIAAAGALAFQAMELTGSQEHIWQSGAFLFFPGAAVLAGWISLLTSRHKIDDLLRPTASNGAVLIENNSSSIAENSI